MSKRVITEEDYAGPRPNEGVREELFAYLVSDDDDEAGVAFWRTAGGETAPMIAPDRQAARSLEPIARRLAEMMDRPLTLVRFSRRQDVETFDP
jgi:hypothetical protein